jgi:hypothetical protein
LRRTHSRSQPRFGDGGDGGHAGATQKAAAREAAVIFGRIVAVLWFGVFVGLPWHAASAIGVVRPDGQHYSWVKGDWNSVGGIFEANRRLRFSGYVAQWET